MGMGEFNIFWTIQKQRDILFCRSTVKALGKLNFPNSEVILSDSFSEIYLGFLTLGWKCGKIFYQDFNTSYPVSVV